MGQDRQQSVVLDMRPLNPPERLRIHDVACYGILAVGAWATRSRWWR